MVTKKFFQILIFLLSFVTYSQQIELDTLNDGFLFREGKDLILKYQVQPKSLGGNYSRNNYIHPVYGWNGDIITEDFPEDHPHQRGIFWAWHQIFKDSLRLGDGWTLQNIHWQVEKSTKKSLFKSLLISNKVLWLSPKFTDSKGKEIPFIEENNSIIVSPKTDHFREIEIIISLKALVAGIKLGGSEDEKGYGGFSARIKLPLDIQFTGSNGKVFPQNLPIGSEKWMDFSGSLGRENQNEGFSIFSHPKNPGFPEPWILRSEKSMQNAVFPFPGNKPIELPKDKTVRLQYKILLHDGSLTKKDLELHERLISISN